jgi:3-methyladenine DNA glycosylase/8-oxoguanine DNA glycosylase
MVPRLLGLDDDPSSFSPPPGAIRELARVSRGLHLGSTGRVVEALVPAVLGQRVTSQGAKRSYHSLVRALGEPAPGPPGLRVPPSPERLATLDYEEFHRHGIERSRAVIVREVARRAKRIEEIVMMDRAEAYGRLQAIRGIGPWTAGHVMGVAWGDRDAVPVGDFHLPNSVSWLLAGEPRADDARMLELLEPYRPHRRRVVVLIKRGHVGAPKYGPKSAVQDIRAH